MSSGAPKANGLAAGFLPARRRSCSVGDRGERLTRDRMSSCGRLRLVDDHHSWPPFGQIHAHGQPRKHRHETRTFTSETSLLNEQCSAVWQATTGITAPFAGPAVQG